MLRLSLLFCGLGALVLDCSRHSSDSPNKRYQSLGSTDGGAGEMDPSVEGDWVKCLIYKRGTTHLPNVLRVEMWCLRLKAMVRCYPRSSSGLHNDLLITFGFYYIFTIFKRLYIFGSILFYKHIISCK